MQDILTESPLPLTREQRVKLALVRGYVVRVVWSESNAPELRDGATYASLHAFDHALLRARLSAPEGAYHKTKFVVSAEGDWSYEGRYDLSRDDHTSIAEHMRDSLKWTLERASAFGYDVPEEMREQARDWLAFVDAASGAT